MVLIWVSETTNGPSRYISRGRANAELTLIVGVHHGMLSRTGTDGTIAEQ